MGCSPKADEDPVARAILDHLAALPPGATASPQDVARAVAGARSRQREAPDGWRRYLLAVRQQALYLARTGRIELVRKGRVVAPRNLKGVFRLRLVRPRGSGEAPED